VLARHALCLSLLVNQPIIAFMPRPSRQIDQALLLSGRALYPQWGAAGLTQRRVAEHAGVQPAMVHYHFGTKQAFVRAVLQGLYDEGFAGLNAAIANGGFPLERLRQALRVLAHLVRQHRHLVTRLASDAAAGEAVVNGFLRDNLPRHMGVLLQLVAEAQATGALPPGPPLQAVVLLMGAVIAPLIVANGIAACLAPAAATGTEAEADPAAASVPDIDAAPAALPHDLPAAVDALVNTDAAIDRRIEQALAALTAPAPSSDSATATETGPSPPITAAPAAPGRTTTLHPGAD
jgi:AcrR family transcriptional regulator